MSLNDFILPEMHNELKDLITPKLRDSGYIVKNFNVANPNDGKNNTCISVVNKLGVPFRICLSLDYTDTSNSLKELANLFMKQLQNNIEKSMFQVDMILASVNRKMPHLDSKHALDYAITLFKEMKGFSRFE